MHALAKLFHRDLRATKVAEDAPPPSRPALEAYREAVRHHAGIREQDTAWSIKARAEQGAIQAAEEAKRRLEDLENRRAQALADADLFGRSDIAPSALGEQIVLQRKVVTTTAERARLSEAKLRRIGEERAILQAEESKSREALFGLLLSARLEAVGACFPALLEAERRYIDALVAIFAAVEACEEVGDGRGGRRHFLLGQWRAGDLLLPRPYHPEFADAPQVMREDIAARVNEAAKALAKEI